MKNHSHQDISFCAAIASIFCQILNFLAHKDLFLKTPPYKTHFNDIHSASSHGILKYEFSQSQKRECKNGIDCNRTFPTV